ncbi:MAG: hypothetical protein AAGA23_16930 [Pseudomonadota bacterium]
MKSLKKLALASLTLTALASGTALAADEKRVWILPTAPGPEPAEMESVEVGAHAVFGTGDPADGATILVRDLVNRNVTAQIASSALEPNVAYSIWWVVFNYPEFCSAPYECTGGDLEVNGGDPDVKASVFWAGGILADGSGTGTTFLNLQPGATTRELFAMSEPYGLENVDEAELHLVLRSHGPSGVAGTLADQLRTANLACPEDGCSNRFFSIHRAR